MHGEERWLDIADTAFRPRVAKDRKVLPIQDETVPHVQADTSDYSLSFFPLSNE